MYTHDGIDYESAFDFSDRYRFACCGPDAMGDGGYVRPKRSNPTFISMHTDVAVGKAREAEYHPEDTTINRCMHYAACTCEAYRKAVSIMEKVEEQDWNDGERNEEHQ